MTDRDLEIPNFVDYVRSRPGGVVSLLDVGAHYSTDYYAKLIRPYVKIYHGTDPTYDERTKGVLDDYLVGDFLELQYGAYHMVSCISTIEHVGMYPKVYENRETAREIMFDKMLWIAQKYLWLSFPCGTPYEIPGEMSIVGGEQCERWIKKARKHKVNVGYYHSDGPQAGYPWELSTRQKVYDTQYQMDVGNQSIVIIEIEK